MSDAEQIATLREALHKALAVIRAQQEALVKTLKEAGCSARG